ncbi:MAG: 3-phosphoserine/phosphohydroxythreonine transaminase [Kiritimatiellia bacterium]
MSRVFNFGAGPAGLPVEVLEEARDQMLDFQGSGMSIMEHSHRGKEYDAVHQEAVANVKSLLQLDADHEVLFLQGGASLQFAMLPMNLLGAGQTADYIHTGAWSGKAVKEAKLIGKVHLAADVSKASPARIPTPGELVLTPGAAYVHMTTNETIDGTEWWDFPRTEAPLVADMSSDILSRPFDANQFGLIYAGAQKNLGPSGLCMVVIRKDLAARSPATLSSMLRYATHLEENSLYNTPPTFGIYILMLVTRWIKAMGAANLYRQNREKAAKLYAAIDGSGGFYRGTAAPECRSNMNVTFRLPGEALEEQFVKEVSKQAMKGLKSHRAVGGIRASIYNAFPLAGIDALAAFMRDFQRKNG